MRVATLPSQSWVDAVGEVDGVQVRAWDLESPLPDPSGVGLVVYPYLVGPHLMPQLERLPDLRVIQLLSAGYDALVPHLPAEVTLCNAAGVHDSATAELAATLVLAAQRGIPEFVLAQQRHEWLPARTRVGLADRRVLVIGYGRIGRAIAARLTPFEVSLTAVATTAREGDEFVDRVHAIDQLKRLLPAHDIVVLIVPLTDGTRGLVNADFLAAMPDDSLLVNVARGQVVDTAALVEATSSGRIRAAVDVTDPEPLPSDHPLWRVPGVLISPHVGGATMAFRPRAVHLLREQLSAYAADAPLAHVVATGGAAATSG